MRQVYRDTQNFAIAKSGSEEVKRAKRLGVYTVTVEDFCYIAGVLGEVYCAEFARSPSECQKARLFVPGSH